MRKLLITMALAGPDRWVRWRSRRPETARIVGARSVTAVAPARRSATASRAPIEVPSEKNLSNPNDPVNKEDAALDRKIKSICRGC